jgi:hypothetical protein
MLYDNKLKHGNPLVESFIKNNFKGVQKPSHKYMDLHINAACIKMLVCNNQTKVQGHGLIHNEKWEEAIQFKM